MTKKVFSEDIPSHVLAVAQFLNGVLNEGREDIRFALIVWEHNQPLIQGLVSNDCDDKTVIGMLDSAKARIIGASEGGVLHRPEVAGHA